MGTDHVFILEQAPLEKNLIGIVVCPLILIKCLTGRSVLVSTTIQSIEEGNAFQIIKNDWTRGSVQSQFEAHETLRMDRLSACLCECGRAGAENASRDRD